jgi:hypothetical protein
VSNKRNRHGATTQAADGPGPAANSSKTVPVAVLLRSGTGLMIAGGTIAAAGTFLPWLTAADGATTAGVASPAGLGALLLALVTVGVGVFVLARPDHPRARVAAWGALVTALGIGALAVLAALAGRDGGSSAAMGMLVSITGGMIATLGVRTLVTRR